MAGRRESMNSTAIHDQNLVERDPEMVRYWANASRRFEKIFKGNDFGHSCDVCDRLWCKNDIKKVRQIHLSILEPIFGDESKDFSLCSTCVKVLNGNKLPNMSKSNGFFYPEKASHLPQLDCVSARLISPRLPFMSIRRLRRDGAYGIIGQVINMPVDVDTMIRHLPRHLDDDYVFNVAIKRKLIHKSSCLSGFVNKRTLRLWLEYLIEQPLYRHLNISVDWSSLTRDTLDDNSQAIEANDLIEELGGGDIDNENLIARQHSLLWNEENVLEIAPAQGNRPLNIIFDHFAEELSLLWPW